MKPQRILAFLLALGAIALGMALLFPKDGIIVGDNIRLVFHIDALSGNADSVNQQRIDSIINEHIEIETDSTTVDTPVADTLPAERIDTVVAKPEPVQTKKTKARQPIEFADSDTEHFKALSKILKNSNSRQIRILHYGDSQIEGDRITGYLRNLLQRKYGGSGPGLMPAMPPVAQSSAINHSASNNWKVYSIYSKKDTSIHHNKFGIMGSLAQFAPTSAWIEFSPSGQAYKSVQNFTQCNVFYGNNIESFTVKGFVDNQLKWFEEFDPTTDTKRFQWNFEQAPKHFRIEIESEKSLDLYAITLDSPTGVIVDNLPFRGSKGTEFVKLDLAQMKQMGHYLPVSLIIYEFGVNAVANNSKNYKYYEQNLRKQLQYLKKVWPKASILVIGVSDMSEKGANGYTTRQSVAKVIEAQRNASFAEGCAFWNLYEAMGGYNSMPVWVSNHLAQKDYTHFNREGGHRVAQMLYDALIEELDSSK